MPLDIAGCQLAIRIAFLIDPLFTASQAPEPLVALLDQVVIRRDYKGHPGMVLVTHEALYHRSRVLRMLHYTTWRSFGDLVLITIIPSAFVCQRPTRSRFKHCRKTN